MTPNGSPEALLNAAGGARLPFRPIPSQSTDPVKRHGHEPSPPPLPLLAIDPTTLMFRAVPEMEWVVQDWLPVGYTTIHYGDGGVGKTLLAQQLMTSCAAGRPWCGLAVMRCRTFGFFCEDDTDELHRRQDRINDALGLQFSDLADMRWASGVGADNRLLTFTPDGSPVLTHRYRDLLEQAQAFQARLIVVDTAADTFGGNENARPEVRQFIGHALNHLAREIKGAVLLNAHPSRSGMSQSGDMDGGSTAWSNSARSRWSLMRPKSEDDDAQDTNERVLTRRKANYASIGDEIRLRWQQGVLLPTQQGGRVTMSTIDRAAAETVFLDLLDEQPAQGRHVSASRNAGNFAPKAFSKAQGRNGHSRREFEQAMESLFSSGTIIVSEYGRPGDRRTGIIRNPEAEGNSDD